MGLVIAAVEAKNDGVAMENTSSLGAAQTPVKAHPRFQCGTHHVGAALSVH
jgi:hypothetical protein